MALVRRRGTQLEEPIPKARSLEFFLSCIRDPHNLRHCALCLDGAFSECTDAEKWKPTLPKLKNRSTGGSKYNPELWNAIVKWLFIKRSKKQMERFLTRLTECTCRMDEQAGDVQRYHQISEQRTNKFDLRVYHKCSEHESEERQRLTKPWKLFLFNLFMDLCVPIQRSPSGSRSSAKGSSTSWPNHSTDLIPYGADTLVQSILQWHQIVQDPLLFTLMDGILKVCRELVIPSLAKYRFTETVVDSTKRALVQLVLDHGTMFRNSTRPRYTFYVIPWQISDAVQYLATSSFTVLHEDYKEALYKGCEVKAMQLCSLIIYIFYPLGNCEGVPKRNVDLTAIVTIGQELFRFFRMDLPSRPPIPVHPWIKQAYESRLSEEMIDVPPRHMALEALRVFCLDMRCANRGCTNSLHTAGKEFQRCAGCGIAAYCGRECQKKAWKDEDHPHKRLCPVFTKMMANAGGMTLFLLSIRGRTDSTTVQNATKEIIHNWKNAQIDDGDTKLIVDWKDALDASRGFTTPLDQRRLSRGFPDYVSALDLLSTAEGAPQPVYFDRLGAQAPTEGASTV